MDKQRIRTGENIPRRKRDEKVSRIRDDEKLLDTQDVADLLKLDVQAVQDYVKAGKIPVIKLSKRCFRFRKADILRWIADRTVIPHKVPLSLVRKGR